jgi:hypothetical protein
MIQFDSTAAAAAAFVSGYCCQPQDSWRGALELPLVIWLKPTAAAAAAFLIQLQVIVADPKTAGVARWIFFSHLIEAHCCGCCCCCCFSDSNTGDRRQPQDSWRGALDLPGAVGQQDEKGGSSSKGVRHKGGASQNGIVNSLASPNSSAFCITV